MSRSTTTTATRRWCPSPEQLMILEELYRRGLKSPNSSQIQKITSHLSLHGKIQGKNVFYWFQNHKARDRQKMRKKLMMMHQHQQEDAADMYLHHHRTYYINNPLFNQLPTNYYYQAQKNLHYPQCTAALDKEGHAGLMRRTWSSSDVQKDYCFNTITSCGHADDSVTINYMDVGPTAPNASLSACFINNNKDRPLQTLELFPLTSSSSSLDRKESKS